MNYYDLFLEICDGESKIDGLKIRHTDLRDEADIRAFEIRQEASFIKEGARKESEILKILMENGAWSEESERALSKKQAEYTGVESSLPKIKKESDRKRTAQYLENLKKELIEMRRKKKSLVGSTLEDNIEYISNQYRIARSLSVDWDEWEYFDDEETDRYMSLYQRFTTKFADRNIGNISLQEFFREFTKIGGEDVYTRLFDRPLVKLTNFQKTLIHYSRIAERLLAEDKTCPEDAKKDIYLLIDRHNSAQKAVEPAANSTNFNDAFKKDQGQSLISEFNSGKKKK